MFFKVVCFAGTPSKESQLIIVLKLYTAEYVFRKIVHYFCIQGTENQGSSVAIVESINISDDHSQLVTSASVPTDQREEKSGQKCAGNLRRLF